MGRNLLRTAPGIHAFIPRTVLAMIVLLSAAAPAHAYFHFMVIEEFYAGHPAAPDAHYVMLRMTSSLCQRFVGGQSIVTFLPDGTPGPPFGTFGSHVANCSLNEKILMGTAEADAFFGIAPDQVTTGRLPFPSGRICFVNDTIDCVAYGDYRGNNGIYKTPAVALVRGMALKRIRFNDRDNNNSTDFALGGPRPTNNSGDTANDGDADLVPDASDCAPGEASVWFAPVEVSGLLASPGEGGSVLLSWNSLDGVVGTSTLYDLVLGSIGGLQATGSFVGVAQCGAKELMVTNGTDPEPVAAQDARFYLVRGRNGCGIGTLGDSDTLDPAVHPRDALDDPLNDPCP